METKIKPKTYFYGNRGTLESSLMSRYKFNDNKPDPNTAYRDWELSILTNERFSVISSSDDARGSISVIKCSACGQTFHDTFNSISNSKSQILRCPHCEFYCKTNTESFLAYAAFLLDEEYSTQYYGFLLALSEYSDEEKYYVIKDTGILLLPLIWGEICPKYTFKDKYHVDTRNYKVISWSRPSWLDGSYIHDLIPEKYLDAVVDASKYWTETLRDAFHDCLFVTEDIYEQIKDHIPDSTQIIDPVLLGKISRIFNPCVSDAQNTKTQCQLETKFKTYYFHNIPIDDLKALSGIKDVSGIYVLRDENNQYYIGQGVHCIKRCLQHFTQTPVDAVNAAYLSGISFVLEDVVTGVEGQDYIHLDTLERMCIEYYNAYHLGYNKTRGNTSHDIVA